MPGGRRTGITCATLPNIEGVQAPAADLTITLDRADLNCVMMGVATLDQLEQENKASFHGDRNALCTLRDLVATFTPDFEILPATAPKQQATAPKPFGLDDLFDHDQTCDATAEAVTGAVGYLTNGATSRQARGAKTQAPHSAHRLSRPGRSQPGTRRDARVLLCGLRRPGSTIEREDSRSERRRTGCDCLDRGFNLPSSARFQPASTDPPLTCGHLYVLAAIASR